MDNRKLSSLKPHPLNAEIYGDGCSKELLDDLKANNFNTAKPIVITSAQSEIGPDVIISGHRRFNAAQMLQFNFVPVLVSPLTSRLDIEEQLIRANNDEDTQRKKTTEQRAREFKALKRIETERAEKRMKAGKKLDPVANLPQGQEGKARDIAADKAGFKPRTAEKAAQVVDAIDTAKAAGQPEYAEDLTERLNTSVDGAYKEARPLIDTAKHAEKAVRSQTILTTEDDIQKRIQAETEQRVKVQLAELKAKKQAEKEEKRQRAQREREVMLEKVAKERESRPKEEKVLPSLLLVDPPWQYRHCATNSRKIENHYETEKHDEIVTHLPETQENCLLFLWVTAPKIAEAVDLIRQWGFDYRTCAVWDKEKIGMGYWFRGEHELLFVAVKGNVKPPQPSDRVSSMFREARTAHSKKPACVYEWIEKSFEEHDKLEMYCRTPRHGWDVWGNEV